MSTPYRPAPGRAPVPNPQVVGAFLREVCVLPGFPQVRFMIRDEATGREYVVSISPAQLLEKVELSHQTLIAAGPSGERCPRCGGSGRL